MENKQFYPKIKNAIFLTIICILLQTAFAIMLGLILTLTDKNPIIEVLGFIIASIASFFIASYIGFKKTNSTFKDVFKINNPSILLWASTFITTLGLVLIISEIDNILNYLLPMPQFFKNEFYKLSNYNILISIIILMIVPAFTEEVFFRGLILYGLNKNYKPAAAILISSLLFGFIHLNPWQFLSGFLIGIYLSWLCIKSGSIFLCMFVHFLNNGIYLFIIRFNIDLQGFNTAYQVQGEFQPLWLDFTGIFLMILGLFLTSYFIKKQKIISS